MLALLLSNVICILIVMNVVFPVMSSSTQYTTMWPQMAITVLSVAEMLPMLCHRVTSVHQRAQLQQVVGECSTAALEDDGSGQTPACVQDSSTGQQAPSAVKLYTFSMRLEMYVDRHLWHTLSG